MEEHARRYTTNQDNTVAIHISNHWKVLDYSLSNISLVFYNHSNCVQLLCYQGFFTSGKKSPSYFLIPPHFTSSFPKMFSIFFLHVIPQVKISDYYDTIQKQGPYLQQLHIRLSLFMYTGVLDENDRMFVPRAAVTCFCVHTVWETQNEQIQRWIRKTENVC